MNDKCQIVAEVLVYLAKHPDGIVRLRTLLDDDKLLYDTADIKRLTGWGATYISNLCTSGRLPHIPGKPTKFVPAAVKKSLEDMQQGAGYGRRKSKIKKGRV